MKKLLSLLLALTLAFSVVGCGKKAANPSESTGEINGYTYPKFQNTDWGMTLEETCRALDIQQSALKKVDGINAYEYEDFQYEGNPALLSLRFTSKDDHFGKLYSENVLSQVHISVDNQLQLDAITQKFITAFGEANDKSTDSRALIWFSEIMITDNFKDTADFDKFLTKYELELYADLDRSKEEIKKRIDSLKIEFAQTPLVKVSTTAFPDINKYIVTFNGIAACYAHP